MVSSVADEKSSPASSSPNSPVTEVSAARIEPGATEAAFLATIEKEVVDARRVQSEGSHADLCVALDTTIRRLEQVVDLLRDSYSHAAELEVQLAITKSNLKAVLTNNEMLEAALARDSAERHVGWRRSVPPDIGSTVTATNNGDSADSSAPSTPSSASSSVVASPTAADPPPPSSSSSASSSTDQLSETAVSSRFFKFRFGRATSGPQRPRHFTSPSMPVLGFMSPQTRIASLQSEVTSLTTECSSLREAKERAEKDKDTLQAEIEVLSQALFEEANKMVSTERRKHANQIAELRTEKRALRHAIMLVESENQRIKTRHTPTPLESIPDWDDIDVESLSRLPLLIPLPFSPQIPMLILNDDHDALDEGEGEDEGLQTARPPPSPDWRQDRAFGRMDTLHMTGSEVLKLLEMQNRSPD